MSFRVIAEFENEETAKSLVKKARQMGGTAEYQSIGEQVVALAKAVPMKFYHLYAILRGEEVGYVGQTTTNPPNARIDQHIRTATNEFYPWLREGLEKGDIHQEFYSLGEMTKGQADAKEQFAIRRLQPVYNRNSRLPMLDESNGNILGKALGDL